MFDFFLADKKRKAENKHKLKEDRYKAIILLCYALINYEKESTTLIIQRPDINTKERLISELNAEWINMVLYASDKVILAMKKFLKLENKSSFNQLILTMRKDLYGIKTGIKIQNMTLNKSGNKN